MEFLATRYPVWTFNLMKHYMQMLSVHRESTAGILPPTEKQKLSAAIASKAKAQNATKGKESKSKVSNRQSKGPLSQRPSDTSVRRAIASQMARRPQLRKSLAVTSVGYGVPLPPRAAFALAT